ncbi:MAG: hypothetical protein PXY39_10985, partial [archaeon]|nr:hypothetical protein [archaeon]
MGLVRKIFGLIILLVILTILVVPAVLGTSVTAIFAKLLTTAGGNTTTSLTSSCSVTSPVVQSIQNDTSYENMFSAYGDSTNGNGWSGGDGAYSVELPNGTELWLFSDTLFGTVTNGQRQVSAFIHNSIVAVQNGAKITETLYTHSSNSPSALVSPSGAGSTTSPWFWLSSAVVSGNQLQVIMPEFKSTGSGAFGFAWVQTYVGTFSLPNMTLQSVEPVPTSASYGIVWSSWALSTGGFTYIYGYNNDSTGGNVNMYAARVSGTNLLGQWQYYSAGSNWSTNPGAATPVMSGLTTGYSVTPLGNYYLLISMNPTAPFAGEIMGYFSCSPTGPFHPING